MERVNRFLHIVALLTLLSFLISFAGCNRDQSERPKTAFDAAIVLNGFDASNDESLKLANVYLTRYLSSLPTAAQDSVWMTYETFINRFINQRSGKLSSSLMVVGGGPYAEDGIVGYLESDIWKLQPDRPWQFDRFAERADSSLYEWLRIQQYQPDSTKAKLFNRIHRLEYWADHFPSSPLQSTMQLEYKSSLRQLLSSLPEKYDPKNSDFVELFHLMHLNAGLDAIKVVSRYVSSRQNDIASLNASAFTDTLRYQPRSWVIVSE